MPYDGIDPGDIKERVCKDGSLPIRPSIPSDILALVNDCRNNDPFKRPSSQDIVIRLDSIK